MRWMSLVEQHTVILTNSRPRNASRKMSKKSPNTIRLKFKRIAWMRRTWLVNISVSWRSLTSFLASIAQSNENRFLHAKVQHPFERLLISHYNEAKKGDRGLFTPRCVWSAFLKMAHFSCHFHLLFGCLEAQSLLTQRILNTVNMSKANKNRRWKTISQALKRNRGIPRTKTLFTFVIPFECVWSSIRFACMLNMINEHKSH